MIKHLPCKTHSTSKNTTKEEKKIRRKCKVKFHLLLSYFYVALLYCSSCLTVRFLLDDCCKLICFQRFRYPFIYHQPHIILQEALSCFQYGIHVVFHGRSKWTLRNIVKFDKYCKHQTQHQYRLLHLMHYRSNTDWDCIRQSIVRHFISQSKQ